LSEILIPPNLRSSLLANHCFVAGAFLVE
jgi:hypothetical protein